MVGRELELAELGECGGLAGAVDDGLGPGERDRRAERGRSDQVSTRWCSRGRRPAIGGQLAAQRGIALYPRLRLGR